MRIVLVSSFPAFPTTAGNRSRIRQLALAIRELGHELHFVYLESKWEACDDAAHEAAFGKARYIRIDRKAWPAKWAWGAAIGAAKRVLKLAGVGAAYYSGLDRFRDRDFLRALRRLDLRPDVVVVEYVLDSWAFAAFPTSARRVLDTHDAFADRHKGFLERGIRDYWVSLRPGSENAGFRRAHVVLACQEEEAQHFMRQLAVDTTPGAPEVAVVRQPLEVSGDDMNYGVDRSAVFLGSDNAANRHAVHAFLEHVLPLAVRELPGFDLKLAGSICGGVADVKNVTKLGWVDDMKAVFARAPLSVNPMLVGTGINIKLLEAMACGVPTVSTATGARGVPESLRRGVHVVPDADAQAFAAALVRFATDADLRRETGVAAREDAKRWNARQREELGRCLAGVQT
jgi:glycosyltransferase involved in cell wall biosynthesis